MSIKLLKRLLSQTLDSSLLCRMLLMLQYCLCLWGFHFAVFVAFIVMHLLVCVCCTSVGFVSSATSSFLMF